MDFDFDFDCAGIDRWTFSGFHSHVPSRLRQLGGATSRSFKSAESDRAKCSLLAGREGYAMR